MRLLKPSRLSYGDTVGVIAPSHPVAPFQNLYDQGIRNLEEFGFKVKEGKTVRLEHMSYMAGTDAQRAEDINQMFADKQVKAIICAMGGQVAIRTLRYLDFDLIKANPKIFSGMSDITTFHTAFLAKTGLSGLHQSDVIFGFGRDRMSLEASYEMGLFLKITENAQPLGLLPKFTPWDVWREGHAEARLFGGNIPSLQTLLSTPYFPEIDEQVIFFWECTVKPLEKIDQDLTQLREVGLLDKTSGMLIGKIRGEDPNQLGTIRDMTEEVRKVILEITEEFDFPIIAGMDFGHYTPNLPLPVGLRANMKTEGKNVRIDESYVN